MANVHEEGGRSPAEQTGQIEEGAETKMTLKTIVQEGALIGHVETPVIATTGYLDLITGRR